MIITDFIKKLFKKDKYSTKKVGDLGEDKAVKYLKSKKYIIIKRNYSNKSGEIDIIAMDAGVLVFVEVKYRVNNIYQKGYDAVGRQKQIKIIKTAKYYYVQNSLTQLYRFDIISIDVINSIENITHIKDAFRGDR